VLALWGGRGVVHRCFRPLDEWRRASVGEVAGRPLACGHFVPEEVREDLLRDLVPFARAE
jgi:haloacetate dehalogenase